MVEVLSRHNTPDVCLIALVVTLSVRGRSNDSKIAKSGQSQRRTHTLSSGIGVIVSAHKGLLQAKEETGTIRKIEKGRKIATNKVSDRSEDPTATMTNAAE